MLPRVKIIVIITKIRKDKKYGDEKMKKNREIDELPKALQKEGKSIPQCIGCVYLEKKNWGNQKYINSININNWIKCNAKCIYCNRRQTFQNTRRC